MSAAAVLKQARADGLKIALTPEGEITARGTQPVIAKWEPALRLHKAALAALLQAPVTGVTAWDAADWEGYFNERAAVAEYDGGLPRHEAEAQAFRCCVAEWLCQNFEASEPGQCAWCNRGDLPGRAVLPYGDAIHGHTHLHGECWAAWWAQRRHAAVEALNALGLHEGRQHA